MLTGTTGVMPRMNTKKPQQDVGAFFLSKIFSFQTASNTLLNTIGNSGLHVHVKP